ncbi:MAG: thioredoxin family protein [Micavibrio aeruginosavorus]|uniref:Thioredoxin family protein n=1 Tax=Micavibrio aeruginosavorus TaxID=349221 RepID=A0A2W5FJ48_9BACT|nr:MAG: thioredoxin family protein [Micavibrio aeruginosavorus]
MKTLILPALALLAFALPAKAQTQSAGAVVGQPAPDFTGTDTHGKEHKLSDFKGKAVVLEWTNPDCPYVIKHYDSGNMQALQKEAVADDVVWLSIASSAETKEGFYSPEESNKIMAEKNSAPTARILDPSGKIGHLYGAKTTPHMFVVDPKGTLVYAGAIDDNDSFKPETIAGAKNYVREALKSIKAGTPVEVATSKPYGCSVKYAN